MLLLGDWIVTFQSSKHTLSDIRLKTGALLIRRRYIDELKYIAKAHRVDLNICSPEGVNKLPSSYVVIKIVQPGNPPKTVIGLFEYAYGALRLVGISETELASQSGDAIIAFFESPIQTKSKKVKATVYEAKSYSKH